MFWQNHRTFIQDGLPKIFFAYRQRYIPKYSEHPDPEPIRAIPGFERFYYSIVSPSAPSALTYYTLTQAAPAPGTQGISLNNILEPPWPFYWREHFKVMNEEGEVYLPFDRLPFRLMPGEHIESRHPLPPKWWSLDIGAFRYLAGFLSDGENTARLSFVRDDGTEQFAIDYRVFVGGESQLQISQAVKIFEGGEERFAVDRGGGSWTFPVANGMYQRATERWPWLMFRDGQFTLANNSLLATTEGAFGFDSPTTWGVTVPATNPDGGLRIRLSAGGDSLRLGTVSAERSKAPRIDTWPIRKIPNPEDPEGPDIDDPTDRPGATNVNDRCTPRLTCPVVYPYGHIPWRLIEASVDGIDEPLPFFVNRVNCSTRFGRRDQEQPHVTISAEIPTFNTDWNTQSFLVDSSRLMRNVVFEGRTLPASMSAQFDNALSLNPTAAHATVEIGVQDFDAQRYKIVAEFRARVFWATLPPGLLGGSPFQVGTGGFQQSPPPFLTFFTSGTSREFIADPEAGEPINANYLTGWTKFTSVSNLHTTNQIQATIEKIVPKFEGDAIPEIELLGSDIDWATSPQPRYVDMLRTISGTLASATGPQTGLFDINVQTDTIDLATLRIRIGGPDAV